MAHAAPLHTARSDTNINHDLCNKAQAKVIRVRAVLSKVNEAAQLNPAVPSALQHALAGHESRANHFSLAGSAAWGTFNRLNVELSRQLRAEMQLIGAGQIPVFVEVRRELSSTTDLSAFREQLEFN